MSSSTQCFISDLLELNPMKCLHHCFWPHSRFDQELISESSSQGCNSLAMLESMFDDVKRMDKRQFLYQVMLGSQNLLKELVQSACHSANEN